MATCKLYHTSRKRILLSDDIMSLIKHVKNATDHIEGSINELEASEQTILDEAGTHKDKLIQRVQDSFDEFYTELTNSVKEQKAILATVQRTLNQNLLSLSSLLESLKQTQYSTSSEWKQSVELDKTSEEVKSVFDEIKRLDLKTVTVRCDFNTSIQPLVDSESKFGKVIVEPAVQQGELDLTDMQYLLINHVKDSLKNVEDAQPAITQNTEDDHNQMQLRKIDKMNIKIPDDTRDCYIRGIDITDEGNIVIADFNNSKIKLFAVDGNSLSYLKLFSKPKEVTVTKESEAVISMLGKQMCKQIGIIDIGENGNLSWKGTIQTTYAVGGITAYQNNLIITCDESVEKLRAVQMIDMDGRVMWTVNKDKYGNSLFDFGRFLTTRCSEESDTLIVTDVGKQAINIIDALSGEVVKVCHVKGREPRGVCVDGRGNVYVCYKSGEITVWSGDMTTETCLVNDPEQLECPLAMVYNWMSSELLVTSSSLTQEQFCNFIHRYKSC